MAPRANWKGFLKVAELTCPVALYTAASTSDRITFHTINRPTGHRVRRQFVDQETEKPVASDEQVKGYKIAPGQYVVLEPEEIAAALPDSDKTLAVQSFVPCGEIDKVYFDKPYYLAPTSPVAEQAFSVICEGMRKQKVAALAQAVLFRRVRTVLIRVHDAGLIATTLNFDYEVRSSKEVFADVPALEIKGEMLDLAKHIITTKRGTFDPRKVADRYEAALADLVRAKLEGKPIKARPAPAPSKVVDLMEALRQSAKAGAGATKPAGGKKGQAASGSKPAAKGKTAHARPEKAAAEAPRRKAS